jgi:hypothetical protein
VGFELMMQVATKDDHEIFMPLMLVVYNILTPTSVNVKLAMSIMFEISVFGALVSTKKDTLKFFELNCHFSKILQCLQMLSIL